jgi:hypothetical protein
MSAVTYPLRLRTKLSLDTLESLLNTACEHTYQLSLADIRRRGEGFEKALHIHFASARDRECFRRTLKPM